MSVGLPIIGIGRIGWSNKRGGCEFYAAIGDHRWGKRKGRSDDDGWGDLLIDHLEQEGSIEGRRVVLVALPLGTDGETFNRVTEAMFRAAHDVLAPDAVWRASEPAT